MIVQAKCFLMLGSNMGNRAENLEKAIALLSKRIGKLLVTSGMYESEPWGYEEELSYYNQAVQFNTVLKPMALLTECLLVEKELGRVRTKDAYEARTIDIDILFYEDRVVNTPDLVIPHPQITERRFVLEPLKCIAPDFIHPLLNSSIDVLLKACTDTCWVKELK